MAAWFIEQPECAKKMYMAMVMAMLPVYIPSVLPINTPLHTLLSVSSIFSMQNSANVCARSTSNTRPSSKNSTAPTSAT
ncbi:hypothetical protein Tdes44962_MAKER00965 [Teratosphaeria destructans]|uniref:Uncharacterized protein n=1 Tax=Teratosphaeria destructans TaxID=418781 RepID=A0A9W7VYW0_9PEZI|nr:hypothetical protein Tdes44962_MAKER00965 [Teratosphaeria destructans]